MLVGVRVFGGVRFGIFVHVVLARDILHKHTSAVRPMRTGAVTVRTDCLVRFARSSGETTKIPSGQVVRDNVAGCPAHYAEN